MAVHVRGKQTSFLKKLNHLERTGVCNQGADLIKKSGRHLLRVVLSQGCLRISVVLEEAQDN